MPLRCIACKRPTTDEQPYYCEQCFIPVAPYKDHTYIGHTQVNCPRCSTPLKVRTKCDACEEEITLTNPPQPGELSHQLKVRADNRAALAQQVLADSRMTQQMIELLGIDHLPREQQGVALSALAREKMHFLSVEYNFAEARTLVDMGYAITTAMEEGWATQIAGMRLATFYYRSGLPMQAADILHSLHQIASEDTEIMVFRKLELKARLALTHRLAGNAELAGELAQQTHEQLLALFQAMEAEVNQIIRDELLKSQRMGLEEATVTYPRVDYIFTIAAILAEETIARGASGDLKVSDLVIDRLLELDNIIRILGEMSPADDTAYFAAHLREYIRLTNGLLWYGDVLLPNAPQRRRLLIERYFDRVMQWANLIPTQHWLPLRPARFLEIFLRAQHWSDHIKPQDLIDGLFLRSADEIKPSWHYVIAEAYSNVERTDDAIHHLEIILQGQEEYAKRASDELRSIASNLRNSIQLEALGIIYGTSHVATWLNSPIMVELEEPGKMSTLRFEMPQQVIQAGIALFGDRLVDLFAEQIEPAIRSVGGREYESQEWHTAPSAPGMRMDIVIIHSQLAGDRLSLLFEGRPQETDEMHQLLPSPLLVLRGVAAEQDLDANTILNHLVDIMTREISEINISIIKNST